GDARSKRFARDVCRHTLVSSFFFNATATTAIYTLSLHDALPIFNADYPPRDYCVQFAETDLHFLQRLCEEEGLHYHFRHAEQGHTLVFGDDQTAFPRLEPAQCYRPDSGQPQQTPVLQSFAQALERRSDTL